MAIKRECNAEACNAWSKHYTLTPVIRTWLIAWTSTLARGLAKTKAHTKRPKNKNTKKYKHKIKH